MNSILICTFLLIFAQSYLVDSRLESSSILVLTVVDGYVNAENDQFQAEAISANSTWKVRLFALDSPKPLSLPINSTETRGLTYVEYESRFSQPTNFDPIWGETFGFSADLFSAQSYIAAEVFLFDDAGRSDGTYFGGQLVTVGGIQTLPVEFYMNLVGEKSNKVSFVLSLEWE